MMQGGGGMMQAGATMPAGGAANMGMQAGGKAKAASCGAAAALCAEAAGCGMMKCDCELDDKKVEIFNYRQGGEYEAVIEYKYVGEGAGNFTRIEVVSDVTGYCWCWGFCGCFIVICACCAIFWPQSTTTTTPMPFTTTTMFTTTTPLTPPPFPITSTTPAPSPPMQCTIFGDPHIRSFDSAAEDYYNTGVWNLVTSPSLGVIIQGVFLPTKATNGLSVTKEIAVGGSLIGNNVLRIGVERAFWNTEPILTTFPSTFICPMGFCTITYNSDGQPLQTGRA